MATPVCNLDVVLSALADATRRAIVERLATAGELSAGEIARSFRISSPAISRHLRVLEEAGIIERRVDRQWRYVRIHVKALTLAKTWLAEVTAAPQRRSRVEVPAALEPNSNNQGGPSEMALGPASQRGPVRPSKSVM